MIEESLFNQAYTRRSTLKMMVAATALLPAHHVFSQVIEQNIKPINRQSPPLRTHPITSPLISSHSAELLPLMISGAIFDRKKRPIAGAVLDIWLPGPADCIFDRESFIHSYTLSDRKGRFGFKAYYPQKLQQGFNSDSFLGCILHASKIGQATKKIVIHFSDDSRLSGIVGRPPMIDNAIDEYKRITPAHELVLELNI
jgi:hypothetical protein